MVPGARPASSTRWSVTRVGSDLLSVSASGLVPYCTCELEGSSVCHVTVAVPSSRAAAVTFEMLGPVVSAWYVAT